MIEEIIKQLLDAQRKIAIDAMNHPDPAMYVSWVGKHQGLQEALNIISDVLKGNEES